MCLLDAVVAYTASDVPLQHKCSCALHALVPYGSVRERRMLCGGEDVLMVLLVVVHHCCCCCCCCCSCVCVEVGVCLCGACVVALVLGGDHLVWCCGR